VTYNKLLPEYKNGWQVATMPVKTNCRIPDSWCCMLLPLLPSVEAAAATALLQSATAATFC
jgi:hypothetical protein